MLIKHVNSLTVQTFCLAAHAVKLKCVFYIDNYVANTFPLYSSAQIDVTLIFIEIFHYTLQTKFEGGLWELPFPFMTESSYFTKIAYNVWPMGVIILTHVHLHFGKKEKVMYTITV